MVEHTFDCDCCGTKEVLTTDGLPSNWEEVKVVTASGGSWRTFYVCANCWKTQGSKIFKSFWKALRDKVFGSPTAAAQLHHLNLRYRAVLSTTADRIEGYERACEVDTDSIDESWEKLRNQARIIREAIK